MNWKKFITVSVLVLIVVAFLMHYFSKSIGYCTSAGFPYIYSKGSFVGTAFPPESCSYSFFVGYFLIDLIIWSVLPVLIAYYLIKTESKGR